MTKIQKSSTTNFTDTNSSDPIYCESHSTYHAQVFTPGKNFIEADAKEIQNIVNYKVLEPLNDSESADILNSGDYIWGRMVRVVKRDTQGVETPKSRLCADGRDQKKKSQVTIKIQYRALLLVKSV